MPPVKTPKKRKVIRDAQREIGNPSGLPAQTLMSWASLSQGETSLEHVPELMFPASALTYTRMRNDGQVNGLMTGTILPITRYEWYIEPNGADDDIVEKIADDLGLPIGDEDPGEREQRRSRRRFNFDEHIRVALLALPYGFYMFEQVYEYRDATQLLHLRKLGERPPWSISEIFTGKDGGLESISQNTDIWGASKIPVEALLAYTWNKEGGNWLGRSMLRSCFQAWVLKDRAIRVAAINAERNGAGTPIIEAPPGADRSEIEWLDAMAQNFKAGSNAGGAIPAGTKLSLKGIDGSQPDIVSLLNFYNEEMARSFLMTFMQMGQSQSGGSYALGSTMVDFFGLMQEAIADWFMGIFNEHQIEDDVDLNYGDDIAAPLLRYRIAADEAPTDGLQREVEDGNVTLPDDIQEDLDSQPTNASRRRRAGRGRGRTAASRGRVRKVAAASPASLPARPLRRAPYEHEIAAAADFDAIDQSYESSLDALMIDVRAGIERQIDELHDAIVEADGDPDALSEIAAAPIHRQAIINSLEALAAVSVDQAVGEARAQGVTVIRPNLSDLSASHSNRATIVDNIVTRDLAQSAVRGAARLTGGGLSAAEVAEEVAEGLRGMTFAGTRETLGGALQGAVNAGRGLVFRRDGQIGDIYSSELLDVNTCSHCKAKDGTHYASMDEAEKDYPAGGFKDCDGGPKCRGTVVKVYKTETNEPS